MGRGANVIREMLQIKLNHRKWLKKNEKYRFNFSALGAHSLKISSVNVRFLTSIFEYQDSSSVYLKSQI